MSINSLTSRQIHVMMEENGMKGLFMEASRIDNRRAVDRKTYDIKSLWEKNHEILRLKFLGWKNHEIAGRLGLTEATVSNTVNSSLGKKKMGMLQDARDADTVDISKKLADLAPAAVAVYEDILAEESAATLHLKKSTADTILKDLLGYAAPKKIEGRFAHAHIDVETIEEIKRRNRAAAAAAGILVEGEGC